jgi:DNA invertase Pin-like site-specific DNA recombinase
VKGWEALKQKRTNMKKAILYARVTPTEKKGNLESLDEQLQVLRRYCKKRKIKIVAVYTDNRSGRKFNRKGFSELLTKLKEGETKADVLLVRSWDRFCVNAWTSILMAKKLFDMNVQTYAVEQKKLSDAINRYLKVAITI